MPAQHVVVTGASGNVGSAVLATLAEKGYRITGLSRRVPTTSAPPFAFAQWTSVDLTSDDDVPALREAMRGADAVVHLAWGFQPSHRLDRLEELGVGGTRRVAEAALAEQVPHLVHMSSVGAYSPRSGLDPVAEDYPTDGIEGSPYSRHKSAAERLLDTVEADHPELLVTRLRPGIIGQRSAGSSFLRYGVPGFLPAGLLRLLPLLPLDRRLALPVVHTEDVAAAIVRVLETGPGGAFNLAADPPVTTELLASALGARSLHVPAGLVRAAVSGLWHARVAQLDPGWIDLAYAVPLLDTTRARAELGWRPQHAATEVIEELVDGLRSADSAPSPVLRPRSVGDNVRQALTKGPVHRRSRP